MSYKQDSPPNFGHGVLKYFSMDKEYMNLNHGSFGTPPNAVQEAVAELNKEIEVNPDFFIRKKLYPGLRKVRAQLAKFLNVKTTEVVFALNTSSGVDLVLRNSEWEEGDVIFTLSTTYGSVSNEIDYLSHVPPYPTKSVLELTFPNTRRDEIIQKFREHIRSNPARPGKKRIAMIDSITSTPAVYFPWKEMVAICKEEGVLSVVDAAHAIGQEVNLNLSEAAPDFWVSNCHKWLFAKRSCAVVYIPERNQHFIKSAVPTSFAYSHPKNRAASNFDFAAQFEWNGTLDHSAFLTIPEALEFREWLGGEEKINAYCRDLAFRGGKLVADILGTRILDPVGDLTLNMVNVELPIPPSVPFNKEVMDYIADELFSRHTYTMSFYHNGAWWTRFSAQVWNELSDFEKAGKIWLKVCKKAVEVFGK
ncbi:hypothetical protein D9613_009930 [Agrocybe pediades]|uniref:Aminotransferase class V domain-containing protein n=1 Tax=Agrocybe pediades TaxID=84607 RepID=A0A8H4VST0_9AGAR|nr:hypothetical protein D9613_009930 [Agrocybe pediades]